MVGVFSALIRVVEISSFPEEAQASTQVNEESGVTVTSQ